MVDKAKGQGSPREKLPEAFHIARSSLATQVAGDAELFLETLAQRESFCAAAA
jgi:hypothetical protein